MEFSSPFHSHKTDLFSPFRSFHRLLLTDFPASSYISTCETFTLVYTLVYKGLNKIHVHVPLLGRASFV